MSICSACRRGEKYVCNIVVSTTTILLTFLSAPACTACTDMVYSKELECDVTITSMAKAILRLKTLASFLHRT